MFFIENGNFNGTSFFGAVLFVPMLFVIVAYILKLPYGITMDMCAAGECVMLALMKVKCMITDCCTGKICAYTSDGVPVYYPVREAEFVNALLIFGVLMLLHRKDSQKGKLYAWYLLVYGATRFALNFFREGTAPFVWILPPGHFWSLIAIVMGVTWLVVMRYKNKRSNNPENV